MFSDNKTDVHVYDYWHVLCKRKLIAFISFALVLTVVILINRYQKPLYVSSVELLVDKNQPGVFADIKTIFKVWDETYLRTQFKIMRSSALGEGVVDELLKDENVDIKKLLNCYSIPIITGQTVITEGQKNALVGRILGSISPNTVGKTRFLNIRVSGGDGEVIAKVANILARVYLEQYKDTQAALSQQRFIFLAEKLRGLRNNIKIGQLALEKLKKEEELVKLLRVYKDMYPEVVKLRAQIKELEMGLTVKLQGDIDSSMDYTVSNRTILEQEISTDKGMHKMLLQKIQEMNVLASSIVSIAEPAWPSNTPVSPKKGLNLLFGCLLGICLAAGLAFFREYLDNSIKDSNDVKRYLELPLLGVIPSTNSRGNGFGQKARYRKFLLLEKKPKAEVLEAYRSFRTNLELSHLDTPVNTFLVTSSIEKEGKSTTAANLAISLTQVGKKVLLVDSDLRRPVFHKVFGIDTKIGLTQILSGECRMEDAVFANAVPNLHIVCGGKIPKNSSELIGSHRMKEFIQTAREKFDVVIFDSPPVKAVTDALVLASQVDGIIFVVQAGETPRSICSDAKSLLERARTRILGVVLNKVDIRTHDYYYHYYSRYYG